MDLRSIKQRFDIIGNSPELDRALEIAVQVAGTDLSVLITGESGVGKEVIPQIIHINSPRKHNQYIAVNCGAIPEGTEVAELPLSTQVRLLRVLQSGEFIKVGSSKVQKTDVRVIAATNVNLTKAIENGKFREDLYYRLNTVPIKVPSLRERRQDIHLLFKKFALDFADKYMMPPVKLTEDAVIILESYRWPGNIRQLKSIAEQISVIEHSRSIGPDILEKYIPKETPRNLPIRTEGLGSDYLTDRDIIFKILYQLRQDIEEMKAKITAAEVTTTVSQPRIAGDISDNFGEHSVIDYDTEEDSLSIQDVNADLIRKALEKNNGKRKLAAQDLGISERTLYRKIKELNLD